MKTLIILFFVQVVLVQLSLAQDSSTDCWCDTSFTEIKKGTTYEDSINWKQINCFYLRKRGKMNPKIVINYKNGQRHGEYVSYHPKEYWVVVRQRGYQQAVPRRIQKVKDFYRREGKSLFGKSEIGIYVDGKKNGVWYSMDTNQRIISKISWENGIEKTYLRTCQGLYDIPNMSYRSAFNSIETLIVTLEDGTHDYIQSGKKIISFQIKNHQLNGELKIYKKAKGQYVYSTHHFSDDCLIDSSLTFSIKGDTTRIETDFRKGLPYKIVSYTPSSRGTAYYRDARNYYELNSDYHNGLIVVRREKENLKK